MASKRNRNLFLITNTTHLLNVKTYIDTHADADNYMVLNIRRFPGHEEFCNRIKQDPEIELLDVIYVDKQRKPPFHYLDIFSTMFKVKQIKGKQKSFDNVFFSNYNSWIQHYILKQYNPQKTVLISDGTGIIPIASLRKEDKTIPFKGSKFFINKILGLSPVENLHFYSPWELDIAASDSVEVFNFKSSANTKIKKDKIYFVGSPLVELGYLDKEKHLAYLKMIRSRFPDGEFSYFSHRREKDENLKEYEFFGKIVRDNIPFEERMEVENELPGMVISYISSVLINLPQVYPQLEFYYLSLGEGDIPEGTKFKDRYDMLEENFNKMKRDNFKELKLDK
ncbi:glycosyltransferase family 52 [Salegentibacter sp. F188]|uniref:Glycosyltransferase family 52 n=1 Tax=Autumnicola patrickiae TaxID=3075591 RepID=A0ABU3E1P2_9FLAO|nr:glycosyltransferase family 52 [Salegentibacter sp. F188]MDT0689818.1 glycosyltransferase family 52 [Salegentibacter sp. F188]